MQFTEEREYHESRARSELDWAYRAEREDVADAHMRLSALHMERALRLELSGDERAA